VDGLGVTKRDKRERFNRQVAPVLATELDFTSAPSNSPAERFAYFKRPNGFLVVAGKQEEDQVELALARGLRHCEDKKLVLALPNTHCCATMQRAPWLTDNVRPDVYLHDGAHLLSKKPEPHKSQCETTDELVKRLDEGTEEAVEAEFAAATTPCHLGERSRGVAKLVEWATKDPRLDPAHRAGARSWHCRGQRVPSIRRSRTGIHITAGVHSSGDESPNPVALQRGDELTDAALATVKGDVEEGITLRLRGALHKPDEHWLQAVIRQDPSIVGVEQPALREVPAWRPHDTPRAWGRGLIDLLGLDGHGDIRVVETKLTTNDDELFVLQGLDYYVWAKAYEKTVSKRLGAPTGARVEIHYVIGDDIRGNIQDSQFAPVQAEGLHEAIAWRFQRVRQWFGQPDTTVRPQSQLFELRQLPW